MTLYQSLAFTAFILALLAAVVGTPESDNVDIAAIAALIEEEKDHITPLELAEQLASGKKIRLIDLRDTAQYFQQHIHRAEFMTLQYLMNGGVKRNEFVVLYSEGGIHASQAWMLMKMKRFDSVFTLLGGFAGWKSEILYPAINEDASAEEKLKFERKKALSQFFGGTPAIHPARSMKKKIPLQKLSPAQQPPPVKFQQEEDKLRDRC